MDAAHADPLAYPPVTAVVLDLHSTLVDQGSAAEWLRLAWSHAGRAGDPAQALGAAPVRRLLEVLDRVWELARVVDPGNRRDLSPELHREVLDAVLAAHTGVDPALAAALHATVTEPWRAYDDSEPLLRELRRRGIPSVVLSNVGVDVRPVLRRTGLLPWLSGVVLSFEVGAVKPQPEAFLRALELAGAPPECALMVGDSSVDDAAAAALGIRTLVLPRTRGPVHGLGAVLRLL